VPFRAADKSVWKSDGFSGACCRRRATLARAGARICVISPFWGWQNASYECEIAGLLPANRPQPFASFERLGKMAAGP